LTRQLHIVCLDVPWPPDYGGAIDMMNRIKLLKKAGIGIHLHYFSYNERGTPSELNNYCDSINVYERKTGKKGYSSNIPYIVASRMNEDLVANLQKDNFPILLEGLHCTGILSQFDWQGRRVAVRMHNEESVYYKEMARSESSWLRKIYFSRESYLIRKYSLSLPQACAYFCISKDDAHAIKAKYRLPDVRFLPAFPSWQKVNGEEGMGNLCLYHGNLSVPENEEAATWLLMKVFTQVRKPFVIAGKKPSKRLQKLADLCQHTCLIADPSESELDDLVRKAHIHVLPCLNKDSTGVRLKLLHALFEGRHCVVNEQMVKGTELEGACHIGTNATAIASIITQLFTRPFSEDEILLRKRLLGDTYNNESNIGQLIQYLW
jgi:hypothetical protein